MTKGRVIGIGGLFLRSPDPSATIAWYRDILGIEPNEYGGFDFLHRDSASVFPEAARTIFTAFAEDSDYFKPSTLPYMINLIVDDLDAILEKARSAGAETVQPREDADYGNFAWLIDPDGRKVELWEPKEPG